MLFKAILKFCPSNKLSMFCHFYDIVVQNKPFSTYFNVAFLPILSQKIHFLKVGLNLLVNSWFAIELLFRFVNNIVKNTFWEWWTCCNLFKFYVSLATLAKFQRAKSLFQVQVHFKYDLEWLFFNQLWLKFRKNFNEECS